jgi:hypothetical protein
MTGTPMLASLDANSRALAEYMSELSEKAYHAAWMAGLEFDLWESVSSAPKKYGRLELTADHATRLRALSEAAGGWIYFSDDEETFVPMAEWLRVFEDHKRRLAAEHR